MELPLLSKSTISVSLMGATNRHLSDKLTHINIWQVPLANSRCVTRVSPRVITRPCIGKYLFQLHFHRKLQILDQYFA
jgi:hypothetical protein